MCQVLNSKKCNLNNRDSFYAYIVVWFKLLLGQGQIYIVYKQMVVPVQPVVSLYHQPEEGMKCNLAFKFAEENCFTYESYIIKKNRLKFNNVLNISLHFQTQENNELPNDITLQLNR